MEWNLEYPTIVFLSIFLLENCNKFFGVTISVNYHWPSNVEMAIYSQLSLAKKGRNGFLLSIVTRICKSFTFFNENNSVFGYVIRNLSFHAIGIHTKLTSRPR